jgi:MFS family permease
MVGMSVIDKLGRKTLLLIGAAGTASCLAGVAWLFTTNSHPGALVWLLVTYIAFFALSQGAVIWVYIGEVFPNSVRSKGQGVGNASHWIMNTIIANGVPGGGHAHGPRRAVCLLRGDDGGAVPGGAVCLSGDQGADAGGAAAAGWSKRIEPPWRATTAPATTAKAGRTTPSLPGCARCWPSFAARGFRSTSAPRKGGTLPCGFWTDSS